MTDTVADTMTGPQPHLEGASVSPATLDEIRSLLHERGLPVDAELVLIDLNPPAGVSVGRLHPGRGAVTEVFDDPALTLAALDEAIAAHLIGIGRVQPPEDAAWREELFDLIARGRDRLHDSDGTFMMGRCHIRLFRMARRDVEEAGRALTARAEELARAAVAGISAPAIVIGAGTTRWPGLRDAIARAVPVPVIDLAPDSQRIPDSGGHHKDPEHHAESQERPASTVPSAGGSEPGGSQNYSETVVDTTAVPDVVASASPTIADPTADGTGRTEPEALAEEHPTSVVDPEVEHPEPVAPTSNTRDIGDATAPDVTEAATTGPPELIDAGVVDVEVVDVEVTGVEKVTAVEAEAAPAVVDDEDDRPTTVIPRIDSPPDATPTPTPVAIPHTAYGSSSEVQPVAPYESSLSAADSVPPSAFSASSASFTAEAPTTGPTTGLTTGPTTGTTAAPASPHRAGGRRATTRRVLTGVALLCALAVVGVAAALAIGGGDPPSSSTAVPPKAENTATEPSATDSREFADPAIYAEARQPARRYTPPPPPAETTNAPAPPPRPRAPRPPPQRGLTLPNPIPGLPPIVLP